MESEKLLHRLRAAGWRVECRLLLPAPGKEQGPNGGKRYQVQATADGHTYVVTAPQKTEALRELAVKVGLETPMTIAQRLRHEVERQGFTVDVVEMPGGFKATASLGDMTGMGEGLDEVKALTQMMINLGWDLEN